LKQLADRVIADVTIDVRRAQAPATSTAAPNAAAPNANAKPAP
jgi:hypothetical protein